MTLKVTNLAETFLAFWKLAKGKPLPEHALLWKTHYAQVHPDVLDFYRANYGSDAPLETSLARYPDVISNIRAVSAGAETAVTESVKACAAALNVASTSDHHIVMVGQFGSNAWADVFRGVPTCFYALELILNVNTLAIVAAHETAHVLHHSVSYVPFDGATVAEKLMLEGLATQTSAVVLPGLQDAVYLWPGYRLTTDAEDVAVWLADCEARKPELKTQLLRDLTSSDPATLARYFNVGSKNRHERTPVRAGYAIGYWLMQRLCGRFALSDLVRWKRERIGREVAEALSSD